jgi:sulfur relay (sulfurtransferase) DsrC/TusE family protein
MNKYLIEILKLQNSVILPGLGALMIPSQKTGKVFFNQHLKFNDGSLARYLAEKEGVELQEAQNKVAKFVREIEAQIGKGEAYNMFEFGKFFKDETGDVKFEMSPLFIANIETSTPEAPVTSEKTVIVAPVAASTEAQNLATQKEAEAKKAAELEAQNLATQKEAEAAKAAELETHNLVTQKEAEAKKAAELAAQNLATQKELEAKKAAESINEVVPEIVTEPINTTKIVPPVIATPTAAEDKQSKNTFVPPPSNPTNETTPSNKKKRSKLPLIILLFLLVGLCVVGFIFKDQITGYFDKSMASNTDSSTTSAQPTVAEDTTSTTSNEELDTLMDLVTTDTLTIPEEVVEEPVAPAPVPTSTSGRFHLIGNSFGEKANAEKYVNKLTEKGYAATNIGRFDGLYLVSVKGYDTKEAAKNDLENVRKDVPKAWLFELKD